MKKEIKFLIWLIFTMFFGGFLNYITKEGYIICCCFILLTSIAKDVWMREE